jgi:hypothetical protein
LIPINVCSDMCRVKNAEIVSFVVDGVGNIDVDHVQPPPNGSQSSDAYNFIPQDLRYTSARDDHYVVGDLQF